MVELPGGHIDRVRAAIKVDQATVTLTVKRGIARGIQQDRGGTALPQGHAAGFIGDRVQQVDRAARVHRSTGQRHAVLLDLVPGQRHVTRRRHDQAIVDDRTRRAARLEAGRDFVAAGGGVLVT